MFRLKDLRFILIPIFILILGGMASGDCEPNDGNDPAVNAVTIGPTETVTGAVCPDDLFDFYTITIPDGSDVSGTVTFSSPQESTVLRVIRESTLENVIDDISTNDTTNSYDIPISKGTITPGKYYFRISFWSSAAYDHDYTLILNLSITTPPAPGIGYFTGPGLKPQAQPAFPPWPSENGQADGARRAKVNGPGGKMKEIYAIDLCDDQLYYSICLGGVYYNQYLEGKLQVDEREERFSNLLAGFGNRIYIDAVVPKDVVYTYAFDIGVGEQWGDSESGPAVLGKMGRVYRYTYGQVRGLMATEADGSSAWISEVPEAGFHLGVGPIGRNIIYNSGYDDMVYRDNVHICSFSTDGSLLWTVGPMDKEVRGIAEDASGNVYFRNIDQVLYKVEPDGSIEWQITMPNGANSTSDRRFMLGPIVGSDGRIWLHTKIEKPSSPAPSTSGYTLGPSIKPAVQIVGPMFYVVNGDGTIYKNGIIGSSANPPEYACSGSNGYFCVSYTDGSVRGFTDWDQSAWTWQGNAQTILDMIMDNDNRLYVLYTAFGIETVGGGCYISVLDSSAGGQLGFTKVDVPFEWMDSPSELAIGENETLIYLNAAGYLKVYGPEVGQLGVAGQPIKVN